MDIEAQRLHRVRATHLRLARDASAAARSWAADRRDGEAAIERADAQRHVRQAWAAHRALLAVL